MKKSNNKILTIIVLVIAITGYLFSDNLTNSYANEANAFNEIEEVITVHYLDVGQADSIFIELEDNKTMLIDAGELEDSDYIIDYIDNLGYNKINFLVATHPHADHIGGMQKVVKNFEVDNVYMPKALTNTKTYENLLKEIDNKNLKIKTAKAGVTIVDDDNLDIDIIAPNSNTYEDLNNYSACIKLTYQNITYLFMGDAESLSENEIKTDIKADVLKVGHHGSDTSSSVSFLKKVNPSYAIISVGEDNSYNHPKKEVLDRLKKVGATIYRTDLNGNIIVKTDGNNIEIETTKIALS